MKSLRFVRQAPVSVAILLVCAVPAQAQHAGHAHPAPSSAQARHADEAPTSRPDRVVLPAGATTVAFPLDLSRGQPVVQVLLNGKGPYPFYLDTGAGATVLNDDVARELGLATLDSTRIGDPANPHAIRADIHRLDSIEIGGLRLEGVRCVSWDRSTLRPGADAPRGVLGIALFSELLLSLDYPKAEGRVTRGALPAPDGERVLAYEAPQGIPVVSVRIGARTYDTHLDSGSPGSFTLPRSERGALRLLAEPVEVGKARTANSTLTIYAAQLADTMRLGGHAFVRPMIELNEGLPHPNLGGRILREFVVTLDQANRRVRFERTGTPAPSAGILVRAVPEGGAEVAYVVAGSAAQAAGVEPGDRILAIGGQAPADLGHAGTRAAMGRSPLALRLQRGASEREVEIRF